MSNPDNDFYYEDGEQPPEQPEEQPAYSGEEEPANPPVLYDDVPSGQPEDGETPFQLPQEYAPDFTLEPEEELPDFDFSRMEDDVAAFHRELNALPVPNPSDAMDEEPVEDVSPAPRRRHAGCGAGSGRKPACPDGPRGPQVPQRLQDPA